MAPDLVPHAGMPEPRGATVVPEGVNFSVYSETASAIWVCLFDRYDNEIGRYELDGHDGHVHFGLVSGIGEGTRYGLRADGPYDPAQALFFDPAKLLVDPYARQIDRVFVNDPCLRLPREAATDTAGVVPKGIVVSPTQKPLGPHGISPGLIYELNVRGYTMRHPGVQGPLRGTIAGLMAPDVIGHFEKLGVDAVELMPIAAWVDEGHLLPLGLTNAWGYNPVTYFAADPRLTRRGLAELRALTRTYAEHGISVLLDVVYNHTGEGDKRGPVLSMRGLDARTYYRHVRTDNGREMVNDTGTGNVLRCSHPEVRRLIVDSLKHWVTETGVSGFRFDLAPILGRSLKGFDRRAETLAAIKSDPLLSKCLLVAEPWDPGPGGYQLGNFGKEFHEWNDKYRDDVRAFWRGDNGKMGALAGRISGSAEVFNHHRRKPSAGVNFIAVHDGFTLADLVSYSHKHNEANGEQNRDGHNHNLSWNHGVEGPSNDPEVITTRQNDVRALLATLFLSRGTLMMQQGDELGRTQRGNNNAYAQDNDLAWVDWARADHDLAGYVGTLNAFRRRHKALTADRFLTGKPVSGVRDAVWMRPDGQEMTDADWHDQHASTLGLHLNLQRDELVIWFNRWIHPVMVHCPTGMCEAWEIGLSSRSDVGIGFQAGTFQLPPRSVVVMVPAK